LDRTHHLVKTSPDGFWKPFGRLCRAFTRNPMYLAELGLWLGWVLFYGSLPVLIGFVGFCAAVNFVVRREERDMKAQFGDVYLLYQSRVPRWLGADRH
jgi:protein-S-isoprenylcysteine O-methyltransferase Ste14